MTTEFDCRVLSASELTKELVQLSVPKGDVEQALKCDHYSVERVYTKLLDVVCGIRDLMPDFECSAHLEHPEWFEEADSQKELAEVLEALFQAIGVRDFTIRDLALPKPKRLARHLSAVVNFAMFCQWKRDKEQQLWKSQDMLEVEGEQRLREYEAAKVEFDEASEHYEDQKRAMDEVELQNEEHKAEHDAHGHIQQQLEKEIVSLTDTRDALHAQLSTLQDEIASSQVTLAKTKDLVVDEDKVHLILRDQKTWEHTIEQLDKSKSKLKAEYTQQDATVNALHQSSEAIKGYLDYLQHTLAPQIEAKKRVGRQCKAKVKELEEADALREKLQRQLRDAEKRVQLAKEKQQRLQRDNAAKLDAEQCTLEAARRGLAQAEAEADVKQAQIDKVREQVKAVNTASEDFKHRSDRKLLHVRNQISRRRKQIKDMLTVDFAEQLSASVC